MSIIRDILHDEGGLDWLNGKFDSVSLFNGEMDITLYGDSDEYTEYAEKCVAHYNCLNENPELMADIRESEKATMERNVLDHEPSQALFVPDDDPLLFYRQILTLAQSLLRAQGSVWFEINEALGEEMIQLGQEMGFEVTRHQDFLGKPRFSLLTLNS